MLDVLQYAVAFVVAIGVLVTVHEYGHFWVARRLGVQVLRFSVGFGRPRSRGEAWRSQLPASQHSYAWSSFLPLFSRSGARTLVGQRLPFTDNVS
jgi:hypothetical protein